MIFLNGEFISSEAAKINPNDRGFLLSDGLFETMRSSCGNVLFLESHWKRLEVGASVLEIPIPYSFKEFKSIVIEILNRNELTDKEASLRLTVTRGPGPRGVLPPKKVNPTIMLSAFTYEQILNPVNLFITRIRRNEFSPLSNIKSLSYLDNILAKCEAVRNGADEAVLLNTKANVAETSAANIFMINDNEIVITPPLEDGVLPGITRRVIIDICESLGLKLLEKSITQNELLNAKEVFLTNSLIGIRPVRKINDQLINEGNIGLITNKLQKAYGDRAKKYLTDKIHRVEFC